MINTLRLQLLKSLTKSSTLPTTPIYKFSMDSIASKPSSLIAVAQMQVTADKTANLELTRLFIEKAAKKGAKMIFFPEACDYIGETKNQTAALAEPMHGPTMTSYSEFAKDNSIWLSMGGVHVKNENSCKILNTHLILDDQGQLVESYVKSHLFDLVLTEKNIDLKESKFAEYGDRLCQPVTTPCGKVSLAICYDLRFVEMSLLQRRAGAQILTFPSAFTVPTGQAHWHALLRARAIETQCYVIAAAQSGRHNLKRESYGHSLIIDPWGKIVEEIDEGPGLAFAEIDLNVLSKIRREMPVFTHRRSDLYNLSPVQSPDEPRLAELCRMPSQYCSYPFGSVTVPGDAIFVKTLLSQAFVNKKPIVPNHVLITPERPAPLISDLSTTELNDFAQTVLHTFRILKTAHPKSTIQLGVQDGPLAGQTIAHTHLHLLPIHKAFSEMVEGHENDADRKWRSVDEMSSESMSLRKHLPVLQAYQTEPYLDAPKTMVLSTTRTECYLKDSSYLCTAVLSSDVCFVMPAPEPVLKGHTLIVLKCTQAKCFEELTPQLICDLFQMVQFVEKKVKSIFNTCSTTVYGSISNDSKPEDLVFHVLPRKVNDFGVSDEIYSCLTKYDATIPSMQNDYVMPKWAEQLKE